MDFRGFLRHLTREGNLTKIQKEVSTELELAGIIDALAEKPKGTGKGFKKEKYRKVNLTKLL